MFGRVNPPGLVYTIDLSKIADRENPRTVEAPIAGEIQTNAVIDWGDGTSETITSGTFQTHTYAAGAGDVFTIVIRNATGHLPLIYFSLDNSDTVNTNKSVTMAVTSIDHFSGWSGGSSARGIPGAFRNTRNMAYIDPRLTGLPRWNDLRVLMRYSAIEQDGESFCFDFANYNTTFQASFYNAANLTGKPFVFWNSDGTLDTDRFPNLTTGLQCYTGCSAALRAQVPTAYGGTMTVS